MLKFLGSGVLLAVGAGALYYWWTHEHGSVEHQMRHARQDLQDIQPAAKDILEADSTP
jgi:hypothetical protein